MEDGDGEGVDYYGSRIFFHIGRKMLSSAKVDGAHVVESWVRGPHGRKDLSHGANLSFQALFVDGLVVGRKDARADFVSKYL